MMDSTYYVGVDLGQARDASAIAVVHSFRTVLQTRNPVTMAFPMKDWLVLRQLERMRLGTDYTTVVERVGQVARALLGLGKVTVSIDLFLLSVLRAMRLLGEFSGHYRQQLRPQAGDFVGP